MAETQADQESQEARRRKAAILAIAVLLLRLEREHKAGLKAAVRYAPARLLNLGANAEQVQATIRSLAGRAILNVRTRTREHARGTWHKQSGLSPAANDVAAPDMARADATAASLARAWHDKVYEATANGSDLHEASASALDELESNVERTATTETIDAWALETDRLNTAAHAAGYVVVETWEGILDTRTCPVCDAMIGETVTRPDRFPQPAPLHPWCRCFVSTVIRAASAEEAA